MEKSFIREYPNCMSLQECAAAIASFEDLTNNQNIFIDAGSEANGGGTNRSDIAIYLEQTNQKLNQKVNKIVGECWEKYIQEFAFLQNQPVISYCSKMQKTLPMGGFHVWHWEHTYTPQSISNRNRMAVWTLYLTDHENEGETEFLAHGIKVKPEKGKFCIFPADYTGVHRGNPVYEKDKYIITGWYEYLT